jgi:PAS domain S-box-containing protein
MRCQELGQSDRILIIDDEPINLRLLSDMLSRRGYLVRSMLNGPLAIESAQAASPDLILLDIMMPDMDGYEVCRRLKEDERTRNIPIIFLSALTEAEDKVKGFACGGLDYITKPFQFEEVIARIETHLKLLRLQREVRMQEKIARELLNASPDAAYLVKTDGIILTLNEPGAKELGQPINELPGKCIWDFLPLHVALVRREQMEKVIRSGAPVRFEDEWADRCLDNVFHPLFDDQGNVDQVAIYARDITEHKRAEKALKAAHDQLHSIIDFLPDATFVIDRDGKVIAWNRAIEAMTEIRANEILGKGNYEYSVPFYGERRPVLIDLVLQRVNELENEYARLERKDEALEGEAYMPNMKDGAVYLFGKAAVLYDSAGNLLGAIESIRDITERKHAEQIRERLVNELESKNAEMERFAYTVSHDLRSPLITVNGLVGFLKSDLEKGNTARIDTYLKRIGSAITKMDNLLKDTLELSRIGRVANPPATVPFDDIVQDALSQVQERIAGTGVKVTVARDMPDVYVDRMRMVEVMVNLIENSIKYMGDQVHPEIEIGHRLNEGRWTFFVKDNGIGIAPSQHDKIFELFYKVNNMSDGTGAGLAIVKRIIEVQGGRIWVKSETGKGSTFCFTLPVTLPLQLSRGV